jgi:hypothetical protein
MNLTCDGLMRRFATRFDVPRLLLILRKRESRSEAEKTFRSDN